MIIVTSNVGMSQPPTFASISTQTLTSGITVTIAGTNFVSGDTAVKFNATSATNVSVASSTSLTCTVPNLVSSIGVTVYVTTSSGTASGSGGTFYGVPSISSYTPTGGKAGDTLTVSGSNFTGSGSPVAKVGTVTATNLAVASNSSLTFTVPAVSTSNGSYNVTYTNPGGTATAATQFAFYVAPTYSSISVPQGKAGTSVTITGTAFVSGSTSVTVGGVSAASVTVASSTSLSFAIPTINTEGAKNISITTPGGSVTANGVFTYYNSYSAVTASYTAAGSGSYTIPSWANFVDVIVLGGGQGGGRGYGVGNPGVGGAAGVWAAATLTRGTSISWATTTLSYTVGSGGAGGTVQTLNLNYGANGGSSSASTVTAAGGSGGQAGLAKVYYGDGPGNYTFNSVTYTGGADNTLEINPFGYEGYAPGGGGQGGAGGFPGTVGGNGAAGAVYFRAYQ